MNRVLASFTTSERNIIVFVLLTIASGYGMLQWRGEQQATMTFSVTPPAVDGQELTPEKVMPPGMDANGLIDLNTADQKLLETLPGIGPSLAGALIRHRESHGAFTSMADVDAVPGIGPAMMAKLGPLVTFGTAIPAAPVAAPPALPGTVPVLPVAQPQQVSAGAVVNINTAGPAELDTLKGVGPALAQRIIQERQVRPFRTVDEIVRVKGIGPKILQDNRHRLSVH